SQACHDRFVEAPARWLEAPTETARPAPPPAGKARFFEIEGMTCASCALAVEKAVAALPGIEGVSVNLATHRAAIAGAAGEEAIVAAVRNAGYDARPARAATAPAHDEEARRARRRLLAA